MTMDLVDRVVRLDELRVGDLLAEGGEGRVFELPLQPHLVLKRYRRPAPREVLDEIVAWPESIGNAELVRRVAGGDGLAGGHRDHRRRGQVAALRSVPGCCCRGPPAASPSGIATARPAWRRSAT